MMAIVWFQEVLKQISQGEGKQYRKKTGIRGVIEEDFIMVIISSRIRPG